MKLIKYVRQVTFFNVKIEKFVGGISRQSSGRTARLLRCSLPQSHKSWRDGKERLRNLHLGQKSLTALIKAGSLRIETFSFHLLGPRRMGSGIEKPRKTASWWEKGHGTIEQEDTRWSQMEGKYVLQVTFFNVKIEKIVGGNSRQSSHFRVWRVGWWHLITSVRLIQVVNNRNDHFRYFLGVRVRLIEVSA